MRRHRAAALATSGVVHLALVLSPRCEPEQERRLQRARRVAPGAVVPEQERRLQRVRPVAPRAVEPEQERRPQ